MADGVSETSPERESQKGPVRLRGRHLQSSTTDQRLLDSRGQGE